VTRARAAGPGAPGPPATVDVHQHIWPAELIAQLRRRTAGPRLDGWTLRLPGEPDFEVNPADHDPAARAALAATEGTDLALISLSSPLGVEHLPAAEAKPLLDAYHLGAARPPPRSTRRGRTNSATCSAAASTACNCQRPPCWTPRATRTAAHCWTPWPGMTGRC
jgi:hypothetical protein